MHFITVIHIMSILITIIGIFQLIPLSIAIYYEGNDIKAFGYSSIINICTGMLLFFNSKDYRKTDIKVRESFAIVTLSWITATLFATLPFMIHSYQLGFPAEGAISSFTDACFEMMSGFTTTGSSILTNIEALPKGLLFWRSLTHWLGGMGIILLAVAILPALGVGGMQLFQAEVPGPTSDKIAPRISQTAKLLWGIYLLFTILQTALLTFGPMDLFDAVCHSFGTVATAGFSTKNLSVGHYESSYVNTVIIVFMFLSGASFTLHYQFLMGRFKAHLRDKEFQFYCTVILISLVLILLDTYFINHLHIDDIPIFPDFILAFEFVLFQVLAILTTTGFSIGIDPGSTYHYGAWASSSQFIIVMLMMSGGSVGSTSGGIKTLRIYLAIKFAYNELEKFIQPRHIKLLRKGKDVIPDKIIFSTLGFLMIHFFFAGTATLLMNFFEGDLLKSFFSVLAALNNIGPGLGEVGPDGNFANISTAGKWLLTFCMLLGRLELFSVLVLFMPITWKKN